MLVLYSKITIGSIVFDYVNSIEITGSYDTFTKKAIIKLPQRFYKKNQRVFDSIKLRDKVEIILGYLPNKKVRFTGYVTKRVPNSPMEVHCEDEAYIYKQQYVEPFTLTGSESTLEAIINKAYSGKKNIFNPKQVVGTYRVSRQTTFLKILQELRTRFKISAWWDAEGVLQVNTQLGELSTLAGNFYYNANIISDKNMVYQEAAEFKNIVKGTSQQKAAEDGTVQSIVVWAQYDDKGNIKTSSENEQAGAGDVNEFSIPYLTQKQLEELCITRLQNITFTGFRGSIDTFGEPIVEVNDDIQIINDRVPEMQGRYRVKNVNIKFGVGIGYRQSLELAKKTGELEL